ncbi:MAG: hypothetical protein QG567_2495 [Campylobacterota bacterium]|nr:hypothetical protein [Campylobacterota bacterium]
MALVTTLENQDNLDVEVRLLKYVTVKSGNSVLRGDLVSLDVAKKALPFLTGAAPETVMYEDVDATLGDVVGLAYRDAYIKASEVNFGTGTDAEVRSALDIKNIFLID